MRRALFSLALVVSAALAAAPAPAQVRAWRPARGLRYLRRETHQGTLHATVHALYVDLCDPAIELRATAPGEGARTTSAWARRTGIAAAVNGDYFSPSTYAPLGPARGAGRAWPAGPREHRDALFVAASGGRAEVIDATAAPALWADAQTAVPAVWTELVAVRERVLVRGVVRESPAIPHDGERHPRTALGLTEDRRTLILVVVEGRSERATGATVRELGEILRGLGASEGMKLDGGGSSTMYLARRGVMNHPSDGTERAVATHLGVIVRRDVPARAPARCVARRGPSAP